MRLQIIPPSLFVLSSFVLSTLAQDEIHAPTEDSIVSHRSAGCSLTDSDIKHPEEVISQIVSLKGSDVRLYMPSNYTSTDGKPVPLIVVLRDEGQTTAELEKVSRLSKGKINSEAVVAYPEIDGSEKTTLTSLLPLITELSDRLCIDPTRIYLTGLGTGGTVASLAACDPEISRHVAAFGMMSPALYVSSFAGDGVDSADSEDSAMWKTCEPGRRPVPVIAFHGNENEKYPFWGTEVEDDGFDFPDDESEEVEDGTEKEELKKKDVTPKRPVTSVVKWLVKWAVRNGCGQGRSTEPQRVGDINVAMLERGFIAEGVVNEGTVMKATYQCWLGEKRPYPKGMGNMGDGNTFVPTEELLARADREANETTEEKEARQVKELEEEAAQQKWEQQKNQELEANAISVVENYLLQGFAHGWPTAKLQQVTRNEEQKVTVKGKQIWFDGTKALLQFFQEHVLPSEEAMDKSIEGRDLDEGLLNEEQGDQAIQEARKAAMEKDKEATGAGVKEAEEGGLPIIDTENSGEKLEEKLNERKGKIGLDDVIVGPDEIKDDPEGAEEKLEEVMMETIVGEKEALRQENEELKAKNTDERVEEVEKMVSEGKENDGADEVIVGPDDITADPEAAEEKLKDAMMGKIVDDKETLREENEELKKEVKDAKVEKTSPEHNEL
ncbi:hypothetical protein K402DRAFT_210451 [Aulographum hederae CBS 113979]|uniref:feruloyl esterase n=1 Tax=Aulographum hederae CBS 113979 TaxID=1176131 RepID=A0A6G1GMM2_9PEZI|nr:hypothetical protein K402DRAFT_210451 [Aulographum hederae CBS 113979]